ncbi:MAG: flagellar motor switch protein FliN [Polyangiales bacterium]
MSINTDPVTEGEGLAPSSMPPTTNPDEASLSMLRDVEVELTLEIGRRRMRIADVLRIAAGQTLQLGKAAGEPLDIYINGRLLGRGEAVVLGDRYGVRITEILGADALGGRS